MEPVEQQLDPVDRQLAAYNLREVESFMACFAPTVTVKKLSGEVIAANWDEMYARYEKAFAAEPNVYCEVTSRLRHNDWVIDYEDLTGYQDWSQKNAIALYRVEGDLIVEVLFV